MAPVTGNIYLGGGGSAVDEAALWRAMLAGKSRIVYWPFALGPERAHAAGEWLTGALRASGASYRVQAADSPIVAGKPLWPDDETTLTDERIDAAVADVLAALGHRLGVRLRG